MLIVVRRGAEGRRRGFIRHMLVLTAFAVTPVAMAAQTTALHFGPATAPAVTDEIRLDTPTSTDVPPESWLRQSGYLQVRNVGHATLQPFLPPAHLATGESIIVAPGGGFLGLAIENEGWAMAKALADRGIAAFVLKYRVLPTPESFEAFRDGLVRAMSGSKAGFSPPADIPRRALDDATAALRYVRGHAASYGASPDKVGMMGLSAGGFLTLAAALELPKAERPAFIAPIYPRMDARTVPADAPPMFVAIAQDEFLMGDGSMGLMSSWRSAKRPVEFHLYQAGGHGFGLGNPTNTTSGWFEAFVRWREYGRSLKGEASLRAGKEPV